MRVALAAVLALGVLLRPAPAAAQAWNSDAALALARRAVLRRGGAVADSSLHDYKAQAHGFLFFLGAFGQGQVTSGTTHVALTAPVGAGLVLLAIGLALAGGLIAGAVGGLRAARLRPADALRHID